MRVEIREIQGKMRLKESYTPIGIFLAGILVFAFATGFIQKAAYQGRPDVPAPIVEAASRKLVDECGVFMWVEWHTPRDSTIDGEVKYVPMRERVKQKAKYGGINP